MSELRETAIHQTAGKQRDLCNLHHSLDCPPVLPDAFRLEYPGIPGHRLFLYCRFNADSSLHDQTFERTGAAVVNWQQRDLAYQHKEGSPYPRGPAISNGQLKLICIIKAKMTQSG